jgi:outer membrane protein, heavy metal efflux system
VRPLLVRAALLGATALWSPLAAAGSWPALLEAAWAGRQAEAGARQAQVEAARAAASTWLPEAPSLTLASRADHVDPRRGAREWEVELSAPLWRPGQRARAQAVADAEQAVLAAELARERWQLAGELREAVWALRLAQVEARSATERQAQAHSLAQDIERRVRAGDLAPLDLNQARAEAASAAAGAALSQATLRSAQQRLAALAPGAETPDKAEPPAAPVDESAHPRLADAQARLQRSSARLAQVGQDTHDAPELALSVTRERDDPLQPWQQRARVAVRLPLGERSATRPQQAAALAEQAQARQALDRARRELAADQAAAEAELDAARHAEAALSERARLAQQSMDWTEQAFRAGQLGTPALLRAAADLADARRQAERARLDTGRAVSRHKHTLGVMP